MSVEMNETCIARDELREKIKLYEFRVKLKENNIEEKEVLQWLIDEEQAFEDLNLDELVIDYVMRKRMERNKQE